MNLSQKFIQLLFKNGKLVFLLFAFLVVFGIISVSQMQRQGFPDIPVNIAGVTVVYPNATAEQIERDVVRPLESAIEELDHVDSYEATASDSFGMLFVTFEQNADIEASVADLEDAMASVQIPEGANEPIVSTYSVNGVGEFVVAVTGIPDEQDLFEAGKTFEDQLVSIDGVREVTALNPLTPELVIEFRSEDLLEAKLTRAEVEQIIQTSNFIAPAGSFVQDEASISVVVSKELTDLSDLENLMIAPRVTLSDVATITTRLNNNDYYNRIGFRVSDEELAVERALLYGIRIEDDADVLIVADGIDALLSERSEEIIHPASEYLVMYSQADATRLQIEEITEAIFGAPIESLGGLAFLGYLLGGLTFVVVLMFLVMNLRVALLSALSIPLTLFCATIYLNFVGIELNTLVLFSMVLVIGLVVDPTIVFLEALERFRSQGMSPREAAAKTLSTVGIAELLAITTNAMVFVPFGVVSGFFGEIIKYIPATVIPALIASMVVPVLFFVPVASYMIRPRKNAMIDKDSLAGTWPLARAFGRAMLRLLGPGKSKALLRVAVFLFILALPIGIGGALIGTGELKIVQFASQDDADFMLVNASINNEWTFEKSVYDVVVPMQDVLAAQPEIKNFSYYSQSGNSFTIMAELLPMDERHDAGLRIASTLAEDINSELEALQLDATIEASTSSEGPPQDAYPVRVRLYGDDLEKLVAATSDIKTHLETVEGVTTVDDNVSNGTSGGSVTFALQGDDPAQNPFVIYGMLSDRLAETELGMFEIEDDSYEVLSVMTPTVTSLDEIEAIVGAETVSETNESISIHRLEGKRYAEVFAAVDDGTDPIVIEEELKTYLTDEKLAELGLAPEDLDYAGAADSIQESFTDLFVSLAIAIFMIYVILVAFFRSFFEPFIIIFAIPLGLVGVLPAVWLLTGQLGFLEILGVVSMAGMVVNVTILLIDYANQLKAEGMSARQAISDAVAIRFRPIMLTQITSFASLIGLMLMSDFWKGLSAAIVFGIISSAFLSLISTPILYMWGESFTERTRRTFGRIKTWYDKHLWRKQNLQPLAPDVSGTFSMNLIKFPGSFRPKSGTPEEKNHK